MRDPIVVKATGLKDFNGNVVFSQADADNILAVNEHDGFLAKTAVVFEQKKNVVEFKEQFVVSYKERRKL